MRGMLILLLAVLSALLCLAVLIAWARSYVVFEHWGRITPDHGADIVRSANGRLHLARHSYWDSTFEREWTHHVRGHAREEWPQYEYQRPVNETLGFARYVGTAFTWPGHLHPDELINALPPRTDPRWWRDNYRVWVVPHWFLAVATGALPCWWLAHRPMKLRLTKLLFCAVLLASATAGVVAGIMIGGGTGLMAALLVLVAGSACLLFWVLVVERFVVPITEGMREAERECRLRRRQCPACGYDLRASRGRCPECGTATPVPEVPGPSGDGV